MFVSDLPLAYDAHQESHHISPLPGVHVIWNTIHPKVLF